MSLKENLLRTVADACYYAAHKLVPGAYAQDGLVSVHCHEFMTAPAFERAYARGVQAIGGVDTYRWHWRIHLGLWAAASAVKLGGDFVECGVNKGFLSSAIMEFLNWNETGKHFYLLDTFSGISDQQVSADELKAGARQKNDARLKSWLLCLGHRERGVQFLRVEEYAHNPRRNSRHTQRRGFGADSISSSRHEFGGT